MATPRALLLALAAALLAGCGDDDSGQTSEPGAGGGGQAGAAGKSAAGASGQAGKGGSQASGAGGAGASGKGGSAGGSGGQGGSAQAGQGGSSQAGSGGSSQAGSGGSSQAGSGGSPQAGQGGSAGAASGSGGAGGVGGSGGSAGQGGSGGSAGSGGGGAGGPPVVCGAPIAPVDTKGKSGNVVGTGTAASCTEAALGEALAKGGIVTFNCGGPAVIAVSSEKELPKGVDTTIDGGGLITLDGGGTTRILRFNGGDFRKTKTVVTLQNITLQNGKASGTKIPDAPAPCSQGTDIDGGGGAILIRDGILHVFNATFRNNQAAPLGPDVAGGAINGQGSLGLVIVGSTFDGNSASNGGAIGCLNTDLAVYDSLFEHSKATGKGANTVDPSKCPSSFNGGEVGDGGNGGAISIDGGSDGPLTICGATFRDSSAGALGGVLFRTPDAGPQKSTIDRSTFDQNHADQGGGAMYIHNTDPLVLRATTLSRNDAPGPGGIQADGTTVDIENSTFSGNSSTKGLGGAMALFGCKGSIKSSTFASNKAEAGSGLFGAAIAGSPTLTVVSTLFDDNTSKDCGAPMACQVNGSGSAVIQWPAKHLVCDNADAPCAGADGTTFADPLLGDLADNGGPTQTALPLAGSPALGKGQQCPATDQRGTPRKSQGCTVGAVEVP